tara:strand:+ start:2762 stop:3022 length:261 start_codon:yes stop_codon:yes gene_type:complete
MSIYETIDHWNTHQSKKLQKTKSTYRVEGVFWVPGYNDFDIDDFEIKAYSKAQAEKLAKMHWMWPLAKRTPCITKLCNNQKLESII